MSSVFIGYGLMEIRHLINRLVNFFVISGNGDFSAVNSRKCSTNKKYV